MTWLLVVLWMLAGFALAAGGMGPLLSSAPLLGAATGAVIGGIWAMLLKIQQRQRELERALTALREQAQPPPQPQPQPPPQPPQSPPVLASPSPARAVQPDDVSPPIEACLPAATERVPRPAQAGVVAASPTDAPAATVRAGALLKRWLADGNVPVKIGVLVSFIGVAAALRYAADHGWLDTPIGWRLSGIAALALAALAFAWRARERQRTFSLSLQGGAIGVLVMTVFAAFRLYELLPAPLAFVLLLALVVATGVLAIVQNSRALAALGLTAAFLAPLLVGTEAGDHRLLFGYYTLVNLAVFGVAWARAWAVLNRLGFVFTFAIGTWWGVLSYEPRHFATTEPYLILFFALYLVIPILYALRSAGVARERIDATLVFGLPLFAFPLQVALLDGARIPVALSALALSVVYALVATLTLRRWRLRPLGDAYAALAVGFLVLAIPFAFSGITTALAWSVQGAALVWLGVRERHAWLRRAGLALQMVAPVAWLVGLWLVDIADTPVLNGRFLGAFAIAAAGAFSALQYARGGAPTTYVNVLAAWALGWWLVGAISEVLFEVPAPYTPDAMLLLAAGTAAVVGRIHQVTRWAVAAGGTVLALAAAVALVPWQQSVDWVLGGLGAPGWALFFVAAWFAQRGLTPALPDVRALAALAVHAALAVVAAAALVNGGDALVLGAGWTDTALVLALVVLGALLLRAERLPLSPWALPAAERSAFDALAFGVLAAWVAWSAGRAGSPAPLPYVPLLNPLEFMQIAVLATLAARVRQIEESLRGLAGGLLALLAITVLTGIALRGVHHIGDIAWQVGPLWRSGVAQAAVSVAWTAAGVAAWIYGSRRAQRAVWLVGATLLAIVLLKLLIVDRTYLSTVAGIVSFLAFGMLSIVVGYLAPAPPAAVTTSTTPRAAAATDAPHT